MAPPETEIWYAETVILAPLDLTTSGKLVFEILF